MAVPTFLALAIITNLSEKLQFIPREALFDAVAAAHFRKIKAVDKKKSQELKFRDLFLILLKNLDMRCNSWRSNKLHRQ